MKTIQHIYALLFLGLFSVSCEIPLEPIKQEKENETVMFSPFTGLRTRSAIDGTTFPANRTFKAAAHLTTAGSYFPLTTFSRSGSVWEGGRYWPQEGTLDFIAYSADGLTISSESTASDMSYIQINIPDNSTEQTDILHARSQNQAYNPIGNPIQFKHAEALIAFTAQSNITYDASGNFGITINSITLNDAYHSGTLKINFNESGAGNWCAWSALGSQKDKTLPGITSGYHTPTTPMDITAAGNHSGIGGHGILVPEQDATSVTVNYTLHNGKYGTENNDYEFTHTETLTGSWQEGKKYIYNIAVTVNGITFTPTVLDWDTDTDDIEIGGLTPNYSISVNRSTMAYDHTGADSGTGQFTVTSACTLGGTSTPSGWKTQIYTGSAWTDLEDAVLLPQYIWLSSFPTEESSPAGLSTTSTPSVPATETTSHEDKLKTNRAYYSDGMTAVDNSSTANAIDLSRYDFVTRRMESARYTANCYVVSSPGWYKFPLVYGNAIENDATVTLSYDPTSVGAGHLDGFKNYKYDLSIAEPWIEKDWYAWLISKNLVNSVRVLWERYSRYDSGSNTVITESASLGSPDYGVVEHIQTLTESDGKYVLFHISPDNIRPGNFLIEIKDAGGDSSDEESDSSALTMWSWHIWITDQPMTEITISNGSETYDILPVNAGWTDGTKGQYHAPRSAVLRFVSLEDPNTLSETLTVTQDEFWEESTTGWGCYYQWGRKDPFLPGLYIYKDDYDMNMRGSIRHPDWFNSERSTYFGTYYYDWIVNNYDNLWDSQWADYGVLGTALPNHKTVMDPSPRRFCVPPDRAFDGFVTYGHQGAFNGGYRFWTDSSTSKTVFFPAMGYIDKIGTQSSQADNRYWTMHAWASLQRRASYGMKFTSSTVETGYYSDNYRACGEAVRPIRFN